MNTTSKLSKWADLSILWKRGGPLVLFVVRETKFSEKIIVMVRVQLNKLIFLTKNDSRPSKENKRLHD